MGGMLVSDAGGKMLQRLLLSLVCFGLLATAATAENPRVTMKTTQGDHRSGALRRQGARHGEELPRVRRRQIL